MNNIKLYQPLRGRWRLENSKPHLWPCRGCNRYKDGRGRGWEPGLDSALTLLRSNLLINSQLVSAARRLINRHRQVARWRYTPPPPPTYRLSGKFIVLHYINRPSREYFIPFCIYTRKKKKKKLERRFTVVKVKRWFHHLFRNRTYPPSNQWPIFDTIYPRQLFEFKTVYLIYAPWEGKRIAEKEPRLIFNPRWELKLGEIWVGIRCNIRRVGVYSPCPKPSGGSR